MNGKRLLFVLLFASATFSAFAYDFSAVAPSGQTLYYQLVAGGACVTYPSNNQFDPYAGYVAPTGSLTIPSTVSYGGTTYSVTSIGSYAFYCCSGLTIVTIPNSVSSIGSGAFILVRHIEYYGIATGAPWGATSLNGVVDGDFVFSNSDRDTLNAYIGVGGAVTIPFSVTTIGNSAFYGCSGLTSITIPNSVTSIGYRAFCYCSSLTTVTIPSSVTYIGDVAFGACSGLTSIFIPDGVSSIGAGVFNGCSGLTSVTIPNSVTSIGNSAFYDCSGLTSVTIPNSVTSIGGYAFDNCSGLTSVTIPNSVTSIGWYAFYNCSRLTSVTIGNSVTSIGDYVFCDCSGLTSVTIPESVTSIGTAAFNQCSSLTSITIPNSVTSIGYWAFHLCDGLTSVTIPSSVTSISDEAFRGCSGLTEIYSESNVAPTLGTDCFADVPSTIPIFIPCGSQLSYYSRWSYFSNFIEDEGYSFSVTTTDSTQGHVAILTTPTCQAPTAVFHAVANNGHLFDHWSDGNTDNPRSLTLTSDTTIVAFFSSLVYDTVFVHDTTYVDILVHDTVTLTEYVTVHDTTYIDVHDTTYINVPYPVHDTTYIDVPYPVHDTTILVDTLTVTQYDTITNTVYDTIDNYVYDTVTLTDTLWLTQYDTLWLHDTIIIHDTVYITEEGIDGVEALNAKVYSREGRIVVEGAEGNRVTLYDVTGRVLATKQDDYSPLRFDAPASGTYLIKIGAYPARRVVVIR